MGHFERLELQNVFMGGFLDLSFNLGELFIFLGELLMFLGELFVCLLKLRIFILKLNFKPEY